MSSNKELKWKNEIKIRLYEKEAIDLFNQVRAKKMSEAGVDKKGQRLISENQIWEGFLIKHLKEELVEGNKSIFKNEIMDLISSVIDKKIKYTLNYVDSLIAYLMPYLTVEDKKTNYLLQLIGEIGDVDIDQLNNPHEQKLNDLDVIATLRKNKEVDYQVWTENRGKAREKEK